jgi:iron complex outermembrane receptor protein
MFQKLVNRIGLSLALIVFLLAFASAQCTLQFTGQVIDADTRMPLSGATIEISALKIIQQTDATGKFVINGICAGNYDVTVTHVSCSPITEHVHFKGDLQHNFLLPHTINELTGVTVTGTIATKGAAISQDIKGKALEATRGLSLGESLQKITGVSVLQTGSNIYKPVIHGLHSSRVLILNNGIRQEGQQWGSEHAPEIDPFVANRLSVVKGASTMRYGGDAIGGVVLVEPKLLPTVPGISGELNIVGFSNNRQGTFSGIVEGASKKNNAFAWRLQGTAKRGGNARTPNYWLANSGSEEFNGSAAMGWRGANKGIEFFYSIFNTRLAIFSGSHIGNVTDLMQAISSKEPPDYIRNVGFSYTIGRPYQQVQHQLAKIKAYRTTGNIGKLNLILSMQYNWRREYDVRRFQSSANVPQLDLKMATAGADLIWDHFNTGHFRGTMGITGSYQSNSYEYRMFIPNYQALNMGAFIIEKWNHKKWLIEGGIRFDHRSIYQTNTNLGVNYPDRTFNNLSGNTGVTYHALEGLQFTLNAATAWRAPQVNELYSDGLHHGSARIEKGDPSLQPERSNSIMFNTVYNKGPWNIEAGTYLKRIDGFIYLYPVYPPELTIRGAFPTFRFGQAPVQMHGFDVSTAYAFNSHFQLEGKGSIVRARNRDTKEWMIQMPADRYELAFQYSLGDLSKWRETYFKISTQYVAQQTRVPATGNIPVQQPGGGTIMSSDYLPPPPAYTLVGLEMGTVLQTRRQRYQITVTANNLLNKVYREYMNAFRYFADEMGTNIGVKLKIPLESRKN